MNNKYKVTYRSATNGNQTYVDVYDLFELALAQYYKILEQFDTFSDVKLIAETTLMQRA